MSDTTTSKVYPETQSWKVERDRYRAAQREAKGDQTAPDDDPQKKALQERRIAAKIESRSEMGHALNAKEDEQRKAAHRTFLEIASRELIEGRLSVPMTLETHRLLRAVAIKRAKETGEEPSIAAVVEDLVQRHRSDLLREAGAVFKRELAKKK